MKTVCLIPARGNSKRIPHKNLKRLNGKPLLIHAIEKAKKASCIDEVWVSTEDSQIAAVSKTQGAKEIMRPAKLASDTATTESVMMHFAEHVDFDYIFLYECTFPLTTADDFDESIRKYFNGDYDSMISLKRTTDFVWEVKENELTWPLSYELGKSPRTQDYKGLYMERGGMYITSRKALLKTGCRVSGKIGSYIINNEGIEIDTPEDFKLVGALLGDQ